jgi:hypothetical protein
LGGKVTWLVSNTSVTLWGGGAYNGAATLDAALESVLAASFIAGSHGVSVKALTPATEMGFRARPQVSKTGRPHQGLAGQDRDNSL